MRLMFCVLCVAIWPGVAAAQTSNFDACIADAKKNHTDSTMENYTSFKCDGATAQKLAVRPDACSSDVRPGRIERRSRQLENGLYMRMIWRTQACAGMCEIRFYDDAREASYLCEVRMHTGESGAPQNDDRPPPRYGRRYPYPYEYRPEPERRWRRDYYDEPPPYRRRIREPYNEVRRWDRWIYIEPQWRRERDYRGDYDRDAPYRQDRDYRYDDYRPRDDRPDYRY